MTVPISRGLLTAAVIAHMVPLLQVDGIFIGRGGAPPEGGWSGGQPGTSGFVGYTVLHTGKAVPLEPDPVGRSRMSWKCGYTLQSCGGNDSHCDDVADRVRVAIVSLPEEYVLRGVGWSLQKVDIPELGSTVSSTAVDPPFWSCTDVVSLWLSRSRT